MTATTGSRSAATPRAAVDRVLGELPTRLEREPGVGQGEGGDETTAVDAAAEAAVVERARGGRRRASRSSRRSSGSASSGRRRRARRRLRPDRRKPQREAWHPVLLALARGRVRARRMEDVELGFVHDFGSGEEWVAQRGEGALLNDSPLEGPGPEGADRDPRRSRRRGPTWLRSMSPAWSASPSALG